ncbi:MAG: polyphosphate:AMP phosphotransferase [Myxococcota bacterium]|nr:polyphosphate:AMP phosphotransferase [Myxococcota bacterium]
MFESAELGHSVGKRDYDKEVPGLRSSLLDAQLRVLERGEFSIVLLAGGVNGGGTGDVVNLLLEWMDPHHVHVHAMGAPTDEERSRPPMWRYWRALPPKGQTGIFFGSWYSDPVADRVYRRIRSAAFARALAETTRFERMLVEEGTLVIKLWMHLSKKDQRKRLEKLESSAATAWRVTKQDWLDHERYDDFRRVNERALRETSTAEAPWTVVDASDARYRDLTIGRLLVDAIDKRLERGKRASLVPAAAASLVPMVPMVPMVPIDARNVIEDLDLSKRMLPAEFDKRFPKQQARLDALSRDKRFRDRAVALVFEGNDAAGKGGAIRRVTRALDARTYQVVPVGPPTEEERAQPYLWRFWRQIPRKGHFVLFDRSWYGRVLVERVEGLTPEPDWTRAYREIVDFEESLVRFGVVVVKFWLAISKEEQLARFRSREKTPFKRFKIGPDDWRNREKWDAYERAICDVVDRTSTEPAPWHLVEANDKRWARFKVLETIGDAIEKAIK